MVSLSHDGFATAAIVRANPAADRIPEVGRRHEVSDAQVEWNV